MENLNTIADKRFAKNIQEGNKVLADFMEENEAWIDIFNEDYDTLMPNSSWDMIIPVWIKFRDLKVDDFDYIDHSDCVDHLKDLLFRADSPSDFFPHLVEAVKWYQSTKK